MNRIETKEELKEALKSAKCCIIYGKPDCLHCTIVRTAVDGIIRHFPLISFFYTENTEICGVRPFDGYPVTALYENGYLIGTMEGSGHIGKIREILNLWFRKDL